MVQRARLNGLPFWNKKQAGLDGNSGDNIVVAFEAYQQLSSVTVHPMTAISQLSTMHEDIVTSARQKRAALIQRLDGGMESLGHGFRHMNREVLRYAPCSVDTLVDRGFGGAAQVSYAVIVLFFGWRDNQEALAYALRVAEHPGIVFTVLRFVAQPEKFLLEGCEVYHIGGEGGVGRAETVSVIKSFGRCGRDVGRSIADPSHPTVDVNRTRPSDAMDP
ncbi:Cation/H(+) antiporter 18 [Acorus calamus]|uniref:Cation/H(+) antiporter 18 n=1 Tax=Acorus calamus TaxID=4465 RepID=A0AAV9CUL8_ACOCL|nr:Cation/H(+) antiporter 18 [Acorus calamus]